MPETVYIESSVISYFTARPKRDVVVSARQAITENWWRNQKPKYEVFVSGLVVQEISKGDEEAAQKRLGAIYRYPIACHARGGIKTYKKSFGSRCCTSKQRRRCISYRNFRCPRHQFSAYLKFQTHQQRTYQGINSICG